MGSGEDPHDALNSKAFQTLLFLDSRFSKLAPAQALK
jgi:hypothetical protein